MDKKPSFFVMANHRAGLAGLAVNPSLTREAVAGSVLCITGRGWLRSPGTGIASLLMTYFCFFVIAPKGRLWREPSVLASERREAIPCSWNENRGPFDHRRERGSFVTAHKPRHPRAIGVHLGL